MSAAVDMHALEDALAEYQAARARWHDDPERYAFERLGLRATHQQRRIFEAIQPEGAKVSVRSGHGTGKSSASAAAIFWFLETRDFPRIPCTAPTSHQLRDVLWAELAKWMRAADGRAARANINPAFWLGRNFRLTNERLTQVRFARDWYAVARTSGKDNPDALQGFHATDVEVSEDGLSLVGEDHAGNILFLVDEASGVFDGVFEVAEGALSSPGSRLLLLGNPTRNTGYFADSHKRHRGEFTTLHLRTDESPLADPGYRQKLVRKYGEDSNIVRVRADGEFPKQDDDVLIPIELVEAAIERPAHRTNSDIRIGLDPADQGGDRAVFTVRRGRNVLHQEVHAKKETMWLVGRSVQLRKKFKAAGIYVDAIGIGAGICSRLAELNEPVVKVIVSRTAPARGRHDMEAKSLRDWLWVEMADWFREEEPSFCGLEREQADDLAAEVCSVRFTTNSAGECLIESKDEMKKPNRLGLSPDLAESLLVTFHPGPQRNSVASAGSRTF
jgi:phage terminase large subunit